ncbi:PhoH family protein [bacterium]|nr:PhoH family protein [bacterium]
MKKNSASSTVSKKNIVLREVDPLLLLGKNDSHLKIIEESFGSKVVVRGENVTLEGTPEEVEKIESVFSELIFLLNRNKSINKKDVQTTIRMVNSQSEDIKTIEDLDSVIIFTHNKHIKPKTQGQTAYFRSVRKNDIVFVIGPAGTGKTYLAVACALSYLKAKVVKKIILARPAVEAGESLGFLPGDLRDKVEPYLRPLYDALFDMMAHEKLKQLIEKQVIEVIPLAYMRGRNLDNSFLILDEAQNATAMQMKMFLTRLGVNSRAIINGDVTQIDLLNKNNSGLLQIQNILKNIDGIDFVYLDKKDVIRHKLIKDIIMAYDSHNKINNNNNLENTETG